MTHEHETERTAGADEGRLERLLTGEAAGRDWLALRDEVEADAGVWGDLAAMADDKAALEHTLAGVGLSADRVALPQDAHEDEPGMAADDRTGETASRRGRRTALWGDWRAWGGWAAAAAVVLSWSLSSPWATHQRPDPGAGPGSGQVAQREAPEGVQAASGGVMVRNAAEALRAYMDKGREDGWVVEELPEHVLIEAHRRPDGEVEVLYLRQILERAVVDEAYRLAEDEAGRLVPVRMERWPGVHEAL